MWVDPGFVCGVRHEPALAGCVIAALAVRGGGARPHSALLLFVAVESTDSRKEPAHAPVPMSELGPGCGRVPQPWDVGSVAQAGEGLSLGDLTVASLSFLKVIRVTGFLKGLYTDAEMKSDNVKDKDAKISFLQKAIDVVVMVTGEPLSAKPARIVAGHEPERTNELLQRIGKCCLHKLSSDDAVKRVLAGEKGDVKGRTSLPAKPQEPDNRNARDEGPRAPREKEDRKNSEKNERSTSRDGRQKEEAREESEPRDKERDKERARENGRDRHKDPERDRAKARARQDKDKDRDRDRDRGNRERGRDSERERERKHEASKEKERERDKGRDRDRDRRKARNGEHSRNPDREKSREHERPEKSSSSGEMSKKLSDGSLKDSKAETETEVPTRASRAVTTKTAKRRSKASLEGDSPSDAEGEVGPVGQDRVEASESPAAPRQPPPSISRVPRPGSARPAPPRVKRQDSVEVLAADRAGRGEAISHVIADSQNSDSDDDGQFVVEAAPPPSEVAGLEVVQAAELEDDQKHGGLVKKILETKKDYEKLQLSPRPGEKERSLVFESTWKKETDIVAKEIEKLRTSIQTLCKSALPLGKVMDYLQEDVDAMQHELQLWQSESQQHADALQTEQSITDCAVEPLKAELAELEQLIRDQQDKICAVKANILKNEEKIQKMVHSINLSARR
ncbi:TRAF3-interacting protein 1 [Pteropus alecto]|uniref:TRAF3-interacting protein 1 n=1 Tax=Pteropus alecto TaxID=9402 RepID=UPI000D536A16|nr:TRAF3-interacting protein 1 [Pteropus alecto]